VNRGQKLIVAEAAASFALMMLYIWRLRFTAPRAWVFILGFFFLSHVVRGERAASLGFRAGNFRECLRTMAPVLLLLVLSLLAAGGLCGILWEFWNYQASARWIYVFPILQDMKVFEMPLPGFLGFPPFALETFAMYCFTVRFLDYVPDI